MLGAGFNAIGIARAYRLRGTRQSARALANANTDAHRTEHRFLQPATIAAGQTATPLLKHERGDPRNHR